MNSRTSVEFRNREWRALSSHRARAGVCGAVQRARLPGVPLRRRSATRPGSVAAVGTVTGERSVALAGPLRVPVAVVAGIAVVAFAVLASRYAGGVTAAGLDARLDSLVGGLPAANPPVARLVHPFGDPLPVVVMAVLLAGACMLLERPRLAVLAVAGPGATGVATAVLKPVVGRTIEGGLAFPSGHAAAVTALAVVGALLAADLLRLAGWFAGLLVALAGLVAASTMGVALVVLGIHYPTDTIGGACTAFAVVPAVAWAVDRVADGRTRT
jgi:membrane-associated phospholipid phosphatase